MFHKLPLPVWKLILSRIYTLCREQFWCDLQPSNTITAFTALRQTCKYMRDSILIPEVCEFILNTYQLHPDDDVIVAIPRPYRFVKAYWDKHVNQRINHDDHKENFRPLQWIRALTFDVKEYSINKVLELAKKNSKSPNYTMDREFGWTIHLTNTTHVIKGLKLDQNVEFIGLPNTLLEIIKPIKSQSNFITNLILRNLSVFGAYHTHWGTIEYHYDHVIIDNCTFKATSDTDLLCISSKKLSITNCKFSDCCRAIKYHCPAISDWTFYEAVMEVTKSITHVIICNNHFDRCMLAINLMVEYRVFEQDEMEKIAIVSGNEIIHRPEYNRAIGSSWVWTY